MNNNGSKRIISLVPVSLVGHDVVEVITSDESIIIEVSFEKHVVKIVFRQVFSQILGDLFQFQSGNLTLNKSIVTALLTSNDDQTLSISARLSLSLILAVASLKNSANSIPPD